jgi:hypothetical protein
MPLNHILCLVNILAIHPFSKLAFLLVKTEFFNLLFDFFTVTINNFYITFSVLANILNLLGKSVEVPANFYPISGFNHLVLERLCITDVFVKKLISSFC